MLLSGAGVGGFCGRGIIVVGGKGNRGPIFHDTEGGGTECG